MHFHLCGFQQINGSGVRKKRRALNAEARNHSAERYVNLSRLPEAVPPEASLLQVFAQKASEYADRKIHTNRLRRAALVLI